jgi:hypothetical protein
MKTKLILVTIAAILAGCATQAPRNLTVVDRGPKPNLQAALELVHSDLKRTLKDYGSLKDFSIVSGDIYPISATNLGFNFEQAWMLCVEYNAKNSYGGYTGLQEHGFPLRVDATNKPYLVSTTSWRTHTNGKCS